MEQDPQTTYTCPMHPEIVSDRLGRCPKCGMKLVSAKTPSISSMTTPDNRGLGIVTWKSYLPLITIIALIFSATMAVNWSDYSMGMFSPFRFTSSFMAGFFLVFGGFKLLDIKGFAEGYSTYDLLAQKVFSYGYVYPFLELGFGLTMLAGLHNPQLLWAEVVVMAFSGLGVVIKMMQGEIVTCVCLGTILKVPLTNITLVEDFGMAILALILVLLK